MLVACIALCYKGHSFRFLVAKDQREICYARYWILSKSESNNFKSGLFLIRNFEHISHLSLLLINDEIEDVLITCISFSWYSRVSTYHFDSSDKISGYFSTKFKHFKYLFFVFLSFNLA